MTPQAIFAFATLIGHLSIVVSIPLYIFLPSYRAWLRDVAQNFGYIISFFIALGAMLGSLYFSDIVGWDPCILCWYQRIAMYPLVVIFALGVWRQDMSARLYGGVIAGIGLLIALYQIYLQIAGAFGASLSGFCTAIGATDCSDIYMLEFGYITFPVMAATGFLIILLLQLVKK